MPIDLPTRTFTVTLQSAVALDVETHTVRATYFQEEQSFVLFKDTRHAVVAAFRADCVVTILRGSVDDAV